MNDMMKTITPKSDQLNADDLVGGHTITITINRAEVKESGEQKVILGYEGDNKKPYKPGKAMCHVLIGLWGKSSQAYVGKSLTLYRDEKIKFGPDVCGGIRISHASHITEPRTIIIPVSKGIRKPFTVKPLIMVDASNRKTEEPQGIVSTSSPAIDHALEIIKRNARDAAINGTVALEAWWKELPAETKAKLKPQLEEYKKIASENEPKTEDKLNVTEG